MLYCVVKRISIFIGGLLSMTSRFRIEDDALYSREYLKSRFGVLYLDVVLLGLMLYCVKEDFDLD